MPMRWGYPRSCCQFSKLRSPIFRPRQRGRCRKCMIERSFLFAVETTSLPRFSAHRDIGVAVRVGRELSRLERLVAHHPLDRSARLTFVEHDRLHVRDSPTIAHVRVDPDRRLLAAWIDTGLPHPSARLQTHRVGRGEVGAAPGHRDRVAVHMLEHCTFPWYM